MHIGDQLLLSLTSKEKPTNLYHIMSRVCEYVDSKDDNVIKRLIGYLLGNDCRIRRPPGCIQFIYGNNPYWRDGWNNLYSNRSCRKVGVYYPQIEWASVFEEK